MGLENSNLLCPHGKFTTRWPQLAATLRAWRLQQVTVSVTTAHRMAVVYNAPR